MLDDGMNCGYVRDACYDIRFEDESLDGGSRGTK